jgi:glycolate oxidase subunit GlcD
MDDRILKELKQVVGERQVLTAREDLLVYECDAVTYHRQSPLAVVFPSTTDQVSRVLRILDQAGIPFVPRGAGTGLSGGAMATPQSVLVEMSRMTRIHKPDPVNRIIDAEPGVVNLHLSQAVQHLKLHFAPDPSSQMASTLGGNIAENAGGPHCLKYGTTTNHVLALEIVLPDGTVTEIGSPWGDTAGLDLVGSFVGSEGTFGIVTRATLRLTPTPQAVKTMLIGFDRLEDASRTVFRIIGEGIIPAALEMIDRLGIEAVEKSVYAAGYPRDVAAVLLVELDGLPAGMDALLARIENIAKSQQASVIRHARDEEERQKLWAGRKKAFGAMGKLAPDLIVQDATVPRSKLPIILEEIYRIAGKYNVPTANVFHAGDGNLHPLLLYDRRDKAMVERVIQASGEMLRACLAQGGTLSGEHGIGLDKLGYMGLVFTEEDMEVMRKVRQVFNPRDLCNPGKVLPTGAHCFDYKSNPELKAGISGI